MKFNQEYKNRFRILKGGKISLVVSALLGGATLTYAAPSGGVVTSGTANIAQSGSVTNITQSTQKASINWQKFNISANETVNFKQPDVNSITLNRVVGNERSVINGALNANGQVWLLNSNGILFGKGAKVNTAGLLATTKNISDADFMSSKYNFKGESTASVINLGEIDISDSGYATLLANTVTNEGTIKALRGSVHLVGANEVTINLNGNSIVELRVDKGVLDALVENKGAVYADGGEIYLTTNAVNELLKGVVNNTGIIEANSLDGITGYVELFAHGGEAQIGGSITALEGFVETSGKEFKILEDATIKAGEWLIDPVNVTIDTTLASTIQTALGTGDVTITTDGSNTPDTSAGESVGDGDINVEADITWETNILTLDADANININAKLTLLDPGEDSTQPQIKMNTGASGNVLVGFNSDGTFKGKVDLHSYNQKVFINNEEYTIILYVGELQAMTNQNYVLGANVNAAATSGWNSGKGFIPIGTQASQFSAKFNGLGHTIDGLFINDSTYNGATGLFGYTRNASFSNIGVTNANITGGNATGALVGATYGNSKISNSYTTGTVNGDQNVGGLVSVNQGIIKNSYSKADVTGLRLNVGGLVGSNSGTIENTYATGTVHSATDNVGGLVGSNGGTIKDSYAIGAVTGTANIGGLVGNNTDTVENSYYDKTIHASMGDEASYGKTTAELQDIGTFSSWDIVTDQTLPQNNYPVLLTKNGKTSWAIYSTGTPVTYTLSNILTGYTYNANSQLLSNFWTTSAIFGSTYSSWSLGTDYKFMYAGNVVTGFTNAGTYSDISIDILKDGFISNSGASTKGKLVIAQKDIALSATKIYDGTTDINSGFTLSSGDIINGDSVNLSGAATVSSKNAGTYTSFASDTLALDNINYKIDTSNIKAIVSKKEVALTNFTAQDKTYDGKTDATVSADGIDVSSIIIGDNASFDVSLIKGVFESAQAGKDKKVLVADSSLLSGEDASNYKLTGTTTATINPKPTPPTPTPEPTPTPIPEPTPKPDPIIEKEKENVRNVITAITNNEATKFTPPKIETPLISTNTIDTVSFGENKMLVSKPIEGQSTKRVSLSQAKEMQSENGIISNEVRVPLSRNSIIELVDGGVRLPNGVEQEFYMADER
jgi:filamentous hemagglutinin family protein